MSLTDIIKNEENIKEAVYAGNIGFEEMVLFYKKADNSEIKNMESFIKKGSWTGVKKLFKKVLGVTLQ